MSSQYQYFAAIQEQIQEIQPDSIISRTLFTDERIKVILFAFDTGQELSEHTASVPAMLHILDGESTITLGTDTFEARSGAWAHMQANLPHGIYAKSPTKMLLIMFKA